MSAMIVITNAPDRDVALKIARALIERKLAACVNILAECTSVYRWQGKLETATEVPLLIKTRAAIYDDVEAAIKSLHPYELPEIVAIPIERGLAYLEWVNAATVTEIDSEAVSPMRPILPCCCCCLRPPRAPASRNCSSPRKRSAFRRA